MTQDCFNNVGSYDCVCKVGYEKIDTDGTCADINECDADFPANVACTNLPGSFELSCSGPGYEVINGTDIAVDGCVNIDECLIGNFFCFEGYFNCFSEVRIKWVAGQFPIPVRHKLASGPLNSLTSLFRTL